MNAALKFGLCIGAGIVVEFAAFVAATAASFAGCGHAPLPVGFSFIFPYLMVIPKSVTEGSVVTFIGHATIFQMPIYGAIVGCGWTLGRFRRFALCVFGVHCVTSIIALIIQLS